VTWLVERVVLASARQEVVEMRRITLVLVLILAVGIWPSGQRATAVPAAPARSQQADFNNDDAADLAIGIPGEDIGTIGSAGAVIALYGSAGGLTTVGGRLFTQVGGPLRRRTSSATPWRPGTSTMTASPIWPPAPPSKLSGASWTLAR
jgi:hypothetical protein